MSPGKVGPELVPSGQIKFVLESGAPITSSFWAAAPGLISRDSASTYGRRNRRVFGQAVKGAASSGLLTVSVSRATLAG